MAEEEAQAIHLLKLAGRLTEYCEKIKLNARQPLSWFDIRSSYWEEKDVFDGRSKP